jgi:hypothetical protein
MPGPSPILLSGADLEEPIPLDGPSGAQPQLFRNLSSGSKEENESSDGQQLFNIFSGGGGDSGASDLELEVASSRSTGSQAESGSDAETLYQELISLEGKRYSIERSIRDLKNDRENGILSDQEYKEKLSQFLDKLQNISKRIDVIRETLD